MANVSQALAGFAVLALGASISACSGSAAIAGSPSALPAHLASGAHVVTPAIKYPFEFLNRTPITITIAPNGSKCMNRNLTAHTMRPNTRWEPSVDTKGSGSCAFAASIFYLKLTSGSQTLFHLQFEKKVHTSWRVRTYDKRSNLIKLCWFNHASGLATGLGVLTPENRHCSPFL